MQDRAAKLRLKQAQYYTKQEIPGFSHEKSGHVNLPRVQIPLKTAKQQKFVSHQTVTSLDLKEVNGEGYVQPGKPQ